jgi:cell division protein FtsZ
MAKTRGGFDPSRLAVPARNGPVVSRIVSDDVEAEAKGFTEIKIVGVGGGGNNALNRMVEAGIRGVDFLSINTDAQALDMSLASRKIPIGGKAMKRLGAGGDPRVGERAAEISRDALEEALSGADMVFITAGMGGGTGTGASPVIAEIARKNRALVVAVVTMPFSFEGKHRRAIADEGYQLLKERVDAIIAIPNDRLLAMASKRMSLVESFHLADNILRQGVQGISDLITVTGLINLDFADVKSIMSGAGTALMAIGTGTGPGRAHMAAEAAIASPLLDVSVTGATGLLINITGGPDMSLMEVSDAASLISQAASRDANIIMGAVISPRAHAEMQVTLIATGFGGAEVRKPEVKVSEVFAKLDFPVEPQRNRDQPESARERSDPQRERADPSRDRPAPGRDRPESPRERLDPTRHAPDPARQQRENLDLPAFLRRRKLH